MNYARWPRTEAEAFKTPEWHNPLQGPYRRARAIPDAVWYWAALILCVIAFAALSGCVTESQVDQDIAADAAQAPIDAAMVAFGTGHDVVWEGVRR